MSSVISTKTSGVKHITTTDTMIHDVGEDLVEIMKNTLEADDSVVTGALKESLEYDKFSMEAGSPLVYSYNVEFGRLPGSPPPLHRIHSWVQKKLNLNPPESVDVARNIQSSIAKNGIKETRFAKRSILQLIGGKPVRRAKKKKSKFQNLIKSLERGTKKATKFGKKATRYISKASSTKKTIGRMSKKRGFKKL